MVAICGGLVWLDDDGRVTSGAAYADEIATWPPSLVRAFPKTIPPNATGVRMCREGGLSPGPCRRIQIRFIVPKADVEAAIASPANGHPKLPEGLTLDPATQAEWLRVIDDGDPKTPLPPGFQFFALAATNENFAFLVANPESGEIVYWATIH